MARSMADPRCVVNYSGGVCSFLAAKRAVERFGASDVVLLFADTREEDEDLYRFLREGATFLGAKLVEVAAELDMDGLIDKYGAIPNSRMGFCTRELKQEVCDSWIAKNAPDSLRVFGLDWTESHRIESIEKRFGAMAWCPMNERPLLLKPMMIGEVESIGIAAPRMYAEGFQHNNCGGGCVKAGIGAWAHLYRTRRHTFEKWEKREIRISRLRGFPCTILKDRTGGASRPLPLTELRERLEKGLPFDAYDLGGCGCFTEVAD
jgi:hypothetical protein